MRACYIFCRLCRHAATLRLRFDYYDAGFSCYAVFMPPMIMPSRCAIRALDTARCDVIAAHDARRAPRLCLCRHARRRHTRAGAADMRVTRRTFMLRAMMRDDVAATPLLAADAICLAYDADMMLPSPR